MDTVRGMYFEFPEALPGGEVVLVAGPGGPSAVRSGSAERIPILSDLTDAQQPRMVRYAGGYLFWGNASNTLMAAPFDTKTLTLTGPPVALSSGLVGAGSLSADFDVAEDGTLIYATGSEGTTLLGGENMGWVDRAGNIEIIDDRLAGDVGDFDYLSLGPNPRYIAAEVQTNSDGSVGEQHQIWIYDLDQQTFIRLTLEGETNTAPVWLDPRTVAYISDQVPDSMGIFAQPFDGSGGERPILDFAASTVDGTLAVTLDGGPGGSPEIVHADPATGAVTALASTRFREEGAAISRDGHWLAYSSDESGRSEIYVRAYPGGERRAAISINGGGNPRWSKSGDALFYLGARGKLMVADLEMGERVSVRSRSELFGINPFELGQTRPSAQFDVEPAGERFLVIVEAGTTGFGGRQNRVLVLNVFDELKARQRR